MSIIDIELIIFDLGGVIVDYSEEQYYNYLSKKTRIGQKRIANVFDPLITKGEIGSINQQELENNAKKALNITGNINWNAQFKLLAKTNIDILKMIKKLRKRYTIALLSNINKSRYLEATKIFINPLDFDVRVISSYIHMRKPQKRIFEYVLKKCDVDAKNTVFIDDRIENINGAKSIGIHGIQFHNYIQLKKELDKLNIIIK